MRLLVAYQTIWDFLDSVSERGAFTGQANGRQLHLALVEALDPEAPISDYYRYHPWKDDGGYLTELVKTCRCICAELPSYGRVRAPVLDGVARCAVQSVNHEIDPSRREAELKDWAHREFTDEHTLEWYELTAAASAFTPHVLLALAAEPSCSQSDIARVNSAYFPSVSLAIAMLDSYADQVSDIASASHSYISHYPSEDAAMKHLSAIIGRTVSGAASLPNGYRHAVITACMVAMYLSKNSANTPRFRAQTHALARAGGPLTKLLLPAARLWRAIHARQHSRRGADTDLPAGLRLPSVVQTFMFWRSPFAYYDRCRHRYGDLFTLQATSHPPFVFFSDPEDIRAIITAPADVLHPGEGANTIRPLVGGESFMLLDEGDHLHGRRTILPALQKRTIVTEADWVIDSVRDAVASWPRDARFALHPRLRTLTLNVILRRIFACLGHESDERLAALQDRVLAMLEVTASVVLSLPILRHGPGRTVWERFLLHRSEADELIWSLIDEHSHLTTGADGNDVLSRLLAARNPDRSPMSRRQLRDNIMTMIVSGHETTSAELAWAFQLLAHNPRVQRRLIEEIDGDGGDEYLTATVQEVLRHRPVFLFTVPRTVKQPIEIGGHTYLPPTHLLGCTYLLHHNPQIYPQPDEFRPERFLEGQPSPHTWMAWGGGRRRCPGQHLAMLEMVTVLRTVLQDMTILPASRRMERPRWRSVIVTPHAGSRVVLRRRERGHFVGGTCAGRACSAQQD